MKKLFAPLVGLLLVSAVLMGGKTSDRDTLTIAASGEALSVAEAWAAAYNSTGQSVTVNVVSTPADMNSESFPAKGIIGFVTPESYSGLKNDAVWNIPVGRDIIVPVINADNHAKDKLMRTGLSAAGMLQIVNGNTKTWNGKDENGIPVHYYYLNDAKIKSRLELFLGSPVASVAGREVKDADEFISALKRDRSGTGFCNLATVTGPGQKEMTEGLVILPVDRNNNGTLEENENIYSDMSSFLRGVWIGKYPRALSSNIYAICDGQPENESAKAFLKWVLTDGQKFLPENGHSDLLLAEREKGVDRIYESNVYTAPVNETRSPIMVFLLLVTGVVLVLVLADVIIRHAGRVRKNSLSLVAESEKVFGERSLVIPQGLYFDKAHTWAIMEQDGLVKVGIDDFLQHVTGKITRIQMKKSGSRVQKGEQILSVIQNGKHLDLYAPVSGIIREHNSSLEADSGLINESPYNEGWIYRIEPSNWQRENQLLFFADKYRQYLAQEFTRLKDFMSSVLASDEKELRHVVLQDGGEFRDGLLSQMGPEVWDDFQTRYIDPSRQIWFYETHM